MAGATLLALLMGGAALAQGIPDRPEKLVFKPLAFEVPRAEAYRANLKNGIPVYLAADPKGLPFVRLRLLIKGGSYLDPKGKEGLAALTVNQMRDGGTDKIEADALDEHLDFLAGKVSCEFRQTFGIVEMEIMAKDLKEGMDLFMQVLTQPAFAQQRLDQAKQGSLQELMARNDDVLDIARAEMARNLNGENHYSSTQPTAASLQAITREDLVAFHARLLHPSNLVVSVSGSFTREAMLDLLEASLGALKAGPAAKTSPKVPAPEFTRKPGIYVVDKDVPQSMVSFAFPGLRRTDADWHAAVVLNQILGGGGFTSRLMKKLRSDEGLTYGIDTLFDAGPYWKGTWNGSFQSKNRSVAYALRLAMAEIEHIKAQPVSQEELAVIKDSIILALPSRWGMKREVVVTFAIEQLLGWPENWWADYREKIQAITAEDVQRVARKYLDASQLVVLVVGKAAELEAGDAKDHPGLLKDIAPLPLVRLPLREPLTLKPLS
jgi:zinc protease